MVGGKWLHGLETTSPIHKESSLDENAITDKVSRKERGAGETAPLDHRRAIARQRESNVKHEGICFTTETLAR